MTGRVTRRGFLDLSRAHREFSRVQDERKRLTLRMRALNERLQALDTLIRQDPRGADLIAELDQRSQEGEEETADDDEAYEEVLGPMARAIAIASENNGLVRIADLSHALFDTGRYAEQKLAYGSAYGVLRQSSRFDKVGRGEFRDTMYKGEPMAIDA